MSPGTSELLYSIASKLSDSISSSIGYPEAAYAVVPPRHAITLTPPDHYKGHDFSHSDVQITIHNTDNEPVSPYTWDDISYVLYVIEQLQREYRNNHYAEIFPVESDRSGPTGRVLKRLSIQRRFRSAGAVSKA